MKQGYLSSCICWKNMLLACSPVYEVCGYEFKDVNDLFCKLHVEIHSIAAGQLNLNRSVSATLSHSRPPSKNNTIAYMMLFCVTLSWINSITIENIICRLFVSPDIDFVGMSTIKLKNVRSTLLHALSKQQYLTLAHTILLLTNLIPSLPYYH